MKMALQLILEDIEFFELIDAEKAEAYAESVNGEVYTWKTTGRWNWLEHGYRIVDVAGLVVIPRRLPDHIDMPDDPVEEGDEDDEDEEED